MPRAQECVLFKTPSTPKVYAFHPALIFDDLLTVFVFHQGSCTCRSAAAREGDDAEADQAASMPFAAAVMNPESNATRRQKDAP
jgi:hypothetical protein